MRWLWSNRVCSGSLSLIQRIEMGESDGSSGSKYYQTDISLAHIRIKHCVFNLSAIAYVNSLLT